MTFDYETKKYLDNLKNRLKIKSFYLVNMSIR